MPSEDASPEARSSIEDESPVNRSPFEDESPVNRSPIEDESPMNRANPNVPALADTERQNTSCRIPVAVTEHR